MEKFAIKDLTGGRKFNFGFLSLSSDEIMEFAKMVDPLDFHTDLEAANNSIFRGLIASGPHIFTKFYKTCWLPLFKPTVKAGLGVNNWRLLLPVYADSKISGQALVAKASHNPLKQHSVIQWNWEFRNENSDIVQSLEITILHWLK
ncbi:MAG: hypothetical protein HYY40_04825 [Bacteroidetes bacterium]|nr:hypothetical protein [Bacteroidota bacterium]